MADQVRLVVLCSPPRGHDLALGKEHLGSQRPLQVIGRRGGVKHERRVGGKGRSGRGPQQAPDQQTDTFHAGHGLLSQTPSSMRARFLDGDAAIPRPLDLSRSVQTPTFITPKAQSAQKIGQAGMMSVHRLIMPRSVREVCRWQSWRICAAGSTTTCLSCGVPNFFLGISRSAGVVLRGDTSATMPEPPQFDRYEQFVALFTRCERAVRGVVRSMLPSPQDADEVMQNVGLTCWHKFADFRDESHDAFFRWACVVARYEVLKYRRKFARDRFVLSEETIQLLFTEAEGRADSAACERRALEECLDRLESADQRLLLSVHTPGDSVAGIARQLGQQPRRLYSRVAMLRDLVGDCVRRKLAEEAG